MTNKLKYDDCFSWQSGSNWARWVQHCTNSELLAYISRTMNTDWLGLSGSQVPKRSWDFDLCLELTLNLGANTTHPKYALRCPLASLCLMKHHTALYSLCVHHLTWYPTRSGDPAEPPAPSNLLLSLSTDLHCSVISTGSPCSPWVVQGYFLMRPRVRAWKSGIFRYFLLVFGLFPL